jgi:membrane protease YdiL (CAAX protease family)
VEEKIMGQVQLDASHKAGISNQSKAMMPLLMLPVRTILFAAIQILFVFILGFSWKDSIAWWPFFAIITNIIVFFLLTILAGKENKGYLDLIQFDKTQWKKDLKIFLWVFPVGGGLGFAGMYGVSFLMYGSFTLPDDMILPLPLWAGILALVLFPITNALVETPTYMGYCLPRLEGLWKSRWLPVLLSAFFLAFQHSTLPIIIDDVMYMAWHFVAMAPLAFTVGIIYLKIRRLVPIMIVHWIMDVMVVLGTFILSIK